MDLPVFVWAGFQGSRAPSPLEGEGQGGGYGGVEGRNPLHEPAQPVSAVCPLVLTPSGPVALRTPHPNPPPQGGEGIGVLRNAEPKTARRESDIITEDKSVTIHTKS